MPFKDTVAPAKNPVPFTVKVSAALPAATEVGEIAVITGAGDVIVNVTAFDAVPDGLAKVICADPG